MVMRLLILGLFGLQFPSFAATTVITEAEPNTSYQGEPIFFKILVQSEGADQVTPPDTTQLSDWQTLQTSEEQNTSSRIIDGRIVTKFKTQYTFQLAPKKAGRLRIPPLPVRVGNKNYLSEELFIDVKTLGSLAVPPPVQDFEDSFRAPEGETFFIRATPNKTKAYVGELVLLNYELYLRNVQLNNPELRKFPDFNGFLKEELFIAKQFRFVTEMFQNQYYRKADLIRYALFPLREGRIKIQSLTFNTEVLVPGSFGQVQMIPMEKQSNTVEIDVKPLPPVPAGLSYNGGVGQFQMNLASPKDALYEKQPFTLELKISGLGNLKSLPAPTLPLPEGVELVQTKDSFEYHADATGEKTFQYLLLPNRKGVFKIPSFSWTYFDPQKGSYVTLMSEEMTLSVQAAMNGSVPKSSVDLVAQEPKAVYGTLHWQTFEKNQSLEFLFWILGGCTILFLGFLNFMEWKKAKEDLVYALTPWVPLETQIAKAIAKKQTQLVATLMDQWIRTRWSFEMKDSSANADWTREDLIRHSESCGKPMLPQNLEKLLQFWSQLDAIRYPREKVDPKLPQLENQFSNIKKLFS